MNSKSFREQEAYEEEERIRKSSKVKTVFVLSEGFHESILDQAKEHNQDLNTYLENAVMHYYAHLIDEKGKREHYFLNSTNKNKFKNLLDVTN